MNRTRVTIALGLLAVLLVAGTGLWLSPIGQAYREARWKVAWREAGGKATGTVPWWRAAWGDPPGWLYQWQLQVHEIQGEASSLLALAAHCRHIEVLHVHAGVTDDFLATLMSQSKPSLTEVVLAGEFTDAGLATLGAATQLNVVRLQSPHITAKGLEALARDRLVTLEISNARGIDDGAAAVIARMKYLRMLQLFDSSITDAGLRDLAQLRNLDELLLYSSAVTDAGVASLRDHPNLVRVMLSSTQITDASADTLVTLGALQTLEVMNAKFTDAGLLKLAQAPQLKKIVVQGTAVTQAGVEKLKELTNRRIKAYRGP